MTTKVLFILLMLSLCPPVKGQMAYTDNNKTLFVLDERNSTYRILLEFELGDIYGGYNLVSFGHYVKRKDTLYLIDNTQSYVLKYKVNGEGLLPIKTLYFLNKTELVKPKNEPSALSHLEFYDGKCTNDSQIIHRESNNQSEVYGTYFADLEHKFPDSDKVISSRYIDKKAGFWFEFSTKQYVFCHQNAIISFGQWFLSDSTLTLYDEHLGAVFTFKKFGSIIYPIRFFNTYSACSFTNKEY